MTNAWPFAGLKRGHYGALLLDPPWAYMTYGGKETLPCRTDIDPYDVTNLDELKALPVGELAAKNCVLFIWTFGAHLQQAIELGESYGFTYSTDFMVWVKTGKHDAAVRPIGMGHWSRKQTEYVLMFTRGKPKRLPTGTSVRQLLEIDPIDLSDPDFDDPVGGAYAKPLVYAARREHSRKPDETNGCVERLVAGPYAELFARRHLPGWDVWGREVSKFDPITLPRSILELLGESDTIESLLA